MAKERATAGAASFMALIASIGVIFAPELERFNSPPEKVLLTLIAAIGLYAVFERTRMFLLKRQYRRILGRWYYATREHEGVRFVDRNVALMEFKFGKDGDLAYEVHLYPSIDGLAAAVQGKRRPGTEGQRGSARSLAVRYDAEDGRADILFRVTYTTGRPEDCDRSGILALHHRLDGTLGGEYVSQIIDVEGSRQARDLSSGQMYATRELADLRDYLTPADQAGVNSPVASSSR